MIKQRVVLNGLLLFWMCIPFSGVSFNPPDSANAQFPIDDPRNPNCPCHHYQKLAEEEYKQLLVSTEKHFFRSHPVDNTVAGNIVNLFNQENVYIKQKFVLKNRNLFRLKNKQFFLKRKLRNKKKIIKRFKRIDDCFRF